MTESLAQASGLEPAGLGTLLKAVRNGALTGGSGLREGSRAAKGASNSVVADAHDADVVDAADGGVAGHALGHLHGDGEVGVGRGREAGDDAGHVDLDRGGLEGVDVGAARGPVHVRLERARAVLVDLPERHVDRAVVGARRQARRRALARRRRDGVLHRLLRLGALARRRVVGVAAPCALCEAAQQVPDDAALVLCVLPRERGQVVLDAGGRGSAFVGGGGG